MQELKKSYENSTKKKTEVDNEKKETASVGMPSKGIIKLNLNSETPDKKTENQLSLTPLPKISE